VSQKKVPITIAAFFVWVSLLSCLPVFSTREKPPGKPQETPLNTTRPFPTLPSKSGATPIPQKLATQPFSPQPFQVTPVIPGTQPANPGGAGQAGDHPFLSIFPELKKSAAPAWLKEGLRLTYDVKSATIPVDFDQKSTWGGGLMQYDIVAVEPDLVVASAKLYLDFNLSGNYHPNLIVPEFGLPGIGEYWIHPAALVNAEKAATQELIVVRMPAQVSGKTYQVVRFQYQSGKAKYVWMFEEATGLRVYYSHEILMNDGGKNSAIISLVGSRQVTILAGAGAIPAYAAPGQTRTYSGTYSATPINTPKTSFPFSVRIKAMQAGKRWVEYQLTPSNGDLPSYRVTGFAQIFDRMWMAPETLRQLRDGQVIDRDPYTGMEIRVSLNQGLVYLIETGKSSKAWLGYEPSTGQLVYSRLDLDSGVVLTSLELRLDK
jgi:hypothetical protein